LVDEFIVDNVLVVTPQGIRRYGEGEVVEGPAGLAIEGDTLKRVREAAFANHVRLCEEPEPEAPAEEDAPAPQLNADSLKAVPADEAPKLAPPGDGAPEVLGDDASTTDTSTSAPAPSTTRKGR
jgi:hypothetical protein